MEEQWKAVDQGVVDCLANHHGDLLVGAGAINVAAVGLALDKAPDVTVLEDQLQERVHGPHVDVLEPVEPLFGQAMVEPEQRIGAEDVLVHLLVVAVDVVRDPEIRKSGAGPVSKRKKKGRRESAKSREGERTH